MKNVNRKKSEVKKHKRSGENPAVAAEQEMPPFLLRLARERHVKIAKDQTVPEHRHD